MTAGADGAERGAAREYGAAREPGAAREYGAARERGWLRKMRPRLPRRRWARWVLGTVAAVVAAGLVLGGTVTGMLVAEDSGPISPDAQHRERRAVAGARLGGRPEEPG